MEKLRSLFKGAKGHALAVVGSAGVLGSSVSMAADFDVTEVTTMITAVGASVALIGAGVLVVKFGAKAWKWLFGAG